VITQQLALFSALIRWHHRIHYYFVYPSRTPLLEGENLTSDAFGTIAKDHAFQISRDDPSVSRKLNKAALALAGYGCCVFVFWYVTLCMYCCLKATGF
jgi:hypothetical protein